MSGKLVQNESNSNNNNQNENTDNNNDNILSRFSVIVNEIRETNQATTQQLDAIRAQIREANNNANSENLNSIVLGQGSVS